VVGARLEYHIEVSLRYSRFYWFHANIYFH